MSSIQKATRESFSNVALAIHGGAGVIREEIMLPGDNHQYERFLTSALRAGFEQLNKGKSALDAVEAAVRYLEDCPVFNAGRGAVYTRAGEIELDASIMDGRSRAAGAIAGVTRVRNPITAARAVMEDGEHVLLVGHGAEEFAKAHGIELVDPSYFKTEHQQARYEKRSSVQPRPAPAVVDSKYGTVGAVAVDADGNLAAGTSTGGTFDQMYGRVGDSPIIGAGTFADNETCAISCTGHGEYFIRYVAAYDVSALMRYKNLALADAASTVVQKLDSVGGKGGMIALDAKGNCALPFNTEGMFRGCITRDGEVHVAMFGNQ